jgi:hypothetical protein
VMTQRSPGRGEWNRLRRHDGATTARRQPSNADRL